MATNRLIIESGTLIDGGRSAPVANEAIVIDGNKIAQVGGGGRVQPGDTVQMYAQGAAE